MFQRDKELRGAGGSGRRDDRTRVLEKAKEQREARALQREKDVAAQCLQRFVRSHLAVRRSRHLQRSDFDAKFSDIARLKSLLQRESLPLPYDLLFELLRKLLFFYNGSSADQKTRLAVLCGCFNDSLADAATCHLFEEAARPQVRQWQLKRLADLCLQAPHTVESDAPMELLSKIMDTTTTSSSGWQADHLASSDLRIWSPRHWRYDHMPRTSLVGITRAQLLTASSSVSGSCGGRYGSRLVAFTVQVASKHHALEEPLVQKILSVPLVVDVAGGEAIGQLTASPLWDRIVDAALSCSLADLPPSPTTGISSMTWLLGNLLWLVDHGSRSRSRSANCVLNQVNMVTRLLRLVPIETFAPSGVAVSWTKVSDSHSMPVVFPEALNRQLLLLQKERNVRQICETLLQFNPTGLRKPLATERPAPLYPSASTIHEQYGFGEIASSSSRSLLTQSMSETWSKVKSFSKASWATKLLTKTGLKKQKNPSDHDASVGSLRDTTRHARQLASLGGEATPSARQMEKEQRVAFDTSSVYAVTKLFATFLSRWPHHARQSSNSAYPTVAMNVLSFYQLRTTAAADESHSHHKVHLVTFLWSVLHEMADFEAFTKSVNLLHVDPTDGVIATLTLFCVTYSHLLLVVEDEEMYGAESPLPLAQVERIVVGLKHALHAAYWVYGTQPATTTTSSDLAFGLFLVDAATKLLRDLYNRCSRIPFCNVSGWVLPGLDSAQLIREVLAGTPRANKLISCMPYILSFPDRVKLFQQLVAADKQVHQAQGDGSSSSSSVYRVRIRRGAILEDGLTKLNGLRTNLKKKINVVFVNAAGRDEIGIDAGGLFKEFWLDLANLAFDLQYGLFLTTDAEQLLYPNPQASSSHFTRESDHLTLFQFVGRILGKALYEGIVVEPKFAQFFLSKLLHSFNHLSELPSLDPEIYKNLMFLKSYDDGDVEDLALTFTIVQDVFGAPREVELVPNGATVAVTNGNRTRYIHLVANYYLNTQIRDQSAAFRAGLADLIDLRWLQLFNEPELQVLISGKAGDIDIADLKAHTKYLGGYFAVDKRVLWLWQALESFSPSERGAFLRFTTSCQRAPSLGFGALTPPFCIQKIPIKNDDELLPSSSTCFNTLKLPTYSSYRMLRAKLLLAVSSGAGFEMS